MATPSKAAKSGSAKKPQVKVGDMKPAKDAKGGRKGGSRASSSNRRRNLE